MKIENTCLDVEDIHLTLCARKHTQLVKQKKKTNFF